jgi:nuclear GTP-binding protein
LFTSDLDAVVGRVEGDTEELTGLQVGNDAIGGIGAKMLVNVQALKPVRVAYIEEDEPEDVVPVLIHRNLPTLRAVLDESDIVIEVLDARDPLPFRSLHLEELIASKSGRQTLLILNKIGESFSSGTVFWLII